MKEKEELYLKGIEYSLQEWKKSNSVSQVKYSENKYKQSRKTKIFRPQKHYSLLY